MSPKLRVKVFPGLGEEIREFDSASTLPFLEVFVFLEGQRVSSYEDFLKLAGQEPYKNKESLEVLVLATDLIDGG